MFSAALPGTCAMPVVQDRKNRILHMLKNITYLQISPEDMKDQGKNTILVYSPSVPE
jgi:hypothetical protein